MSNKLFSSVLLCLFMSIILNGQRISPVISTSTFHDALVHKQALLPNRTYDLLSQTLPKNKLHSGLLSAANYYTIDDKALEQIIAEKPSFWKHSIQIKNKHIELLLERVEILSPDFHIKTSQGQTIYPDISQDVYYRGTVVGDGLSWATFTIQDGIAKYLIASSNGNYEINKVSADTYIGYYSDAHAVKPDYESMTDDDINETVDHHSHGGARYGSCLEVYIECDYKTYQDHGSNVIAVTNWVRSIIGDVATVYALHDVPIVMAQLFIWTTPDAYASETNVGAVRDLFVSTIQNNYNGRIAQLLSTRTLGGGISYGIGGYCNTYPTYPGPYCVSTGLSTTIDPFPNYSFNTYVVAHEMGHVMGLRHTHACVWNNTNTQIDDCGNVDAINTGGTPEGSSCFDVLNPILPVSGGSIMSNCHLISGVGIDLNLGFGSIPGSMLYDNFTYADCATGGACSSLPPLNDLCTDAIALPVFSTCMNNTFTNARATATSGVPSFLCGNAGSQPKDIWFTVIVPPSGNITIETSQAPGGLTDVIIQVYAGSCNTLTTIACDDNGGTDNHALLALTGRTPGETLRIRLVDSGSNNEGIFNICAYDADLPCHPDYSALVEFYNNNGGTNWVNKNGWQDGANGSSCNVCTWYGVTCNEQNRVIGINLASNNITGSSIPASFSTLTYLNTLSLYNNQLSGSIPSVLYNFGFLISLDLGSNNLTGTISPSFGTMTSLKNLYLDGNNLSGNLPTQLTDIDLNLLYVNDNNLSGCFPSTYIEYCTKSYNFADNPLLANGVSFLDFCAFGDGGDADMDSFCKGGLDCDDTDPMIYPGAVEICNEKDDDCDGLIDDVANPLTNTWITGSGDWNVAANWSLNMVPLRCQNVVIVGAAGTTVTIFGSQLGVARSVVVSANTHLIIQNNAELSINHGLNLVNQGTITNDGVMTVSNIIDNALYGINNAGTITNNSSGNIIIENSGLISVANTTAGSIYNNGVLTINRNAFQSESTGIYNQGNITNLNNIAVRNIIGAAQVIVSPGSTFTNIDPAVLSIRTN